MVVINIVTIIVKGKYTQAIICIQTLVKKSHSKIGCETACRYVCVLDTKRDEVIGNRRHKQVILAKVKVYE